MLKMCLLTSNTSKKINIDSMFNHSSSIIRFTIAVFSRFKSLKSLPLSAWCKRVIVVLRLFADYNSQALIVIVIFDLYELLWLIRDGAKMLLAVFDLH